MIDQALAIINVLDNLASSGKFTVIIEPLLGTVRISVGYD